MYPQINNKSSFFTQRSKSINPAAETPLPLGTIINKHKTPIRSSNKINTFGIQHHAAPSIDLFKSKEVNMTNNVFDHTKIINTTTGEHSSQNLLDSQDGGNSYKEDRRSGVQYGSTILKNEDM